MNGTFAVLAVLALIVAAAAWAAIHLARLASRAKTTLARMAAIETSTAAEGSPFGSIELAGVAVPLDEGSVMVAPLSGARCLWWRVSIEESNGSSITSIATESDARDFYLDDGSGAVARVLTSRANVDMVERTTDPAWVARAARLLTELGITKDVKSLLWFEERIDVRADVYVLGYARPAEGTSTDGGAPFRPRGFARERLVIDEPDGGELLVSVGHEAALATKLRVDMHNASNMAKVCGALATVFALGFGILVVLYLRDSS